MFVSRPVWLALLTATLLIGGAGCDPPGQSHEEADGVNQKPPSLAPPKIVTDAIDSVKKQFSATGSMALEVDPPLKLDKCYARFTPLHTGGSVLQVSSYKTVEMETFPSVCFVAPVAAASPKGLVGQQVSGEFYLLRTKDGPLLSSPGRTVELLIDSVKDGRLKATIVGGELTSAGDPQSLRLGGKIDAILPEEEWAP